MMTDKARKARNEYQKQFRAKNPDKIRQYNINYWERKAMMLKGETIESKVIELKKQGFSLREIGLKLGISHMKVSRILQDCNTL
jgi:DNA-directed RNA polymerase specialized sigma subunit